MKPQDFENKLAEARRARTVSGTQDNAAAFERDFLDGGWFKSSELTTPVREPVQEVRDAISQNRSRTRKQRLRH